ncbi:MAG: hypothetical protein HLUCCA24_00580, partial [Rhodobacteraceae bacterium HLUCCA24]
MRRAIAALAATTLAAVSAAPASAEGISAKRIKPPAAGEPRITVQITPEDIARQRALPVAPSPRPDADERTSRAAPATPGRYAWFWQAVSPARDAATGPARAEPALASLAEGPAAV